jgi:hypothetical protein
MGEAQEMSMSLANLSFIRTSKERAPWITFSARLDGVG